MTLNLQKWLAEGPDELEKQYPGITAAMQREGQCDLKNIQRRFERAMCGRRIGSDSMEAIAEEINTVRLSVMREYHGLISRMPSVLIEFFMAAQNKSYDGPLPLSRILIR